MVRLARRSKARGGGRNSRIALPVLLATLLLGVSMFILAPPASAGNVIHVPIRWCGIEGAPSMVDPGLVFESTTHDVLWRRHERPSDLVYIPQVEMSFRSGATAALPDFPVIPDPTLSTGSNPGDVVSPDIDDTEWLEIINACRQEWQDNAPDVVGLTAISMNEFVDLDGNVQGYWGWGGRPTFSNGAEQTDFGRAMIVDPSIVLDTCGQTAHNGRELWEWVDGALVGHEFGHGLSLRHGDGIDSDGDGDLDEADEGDALYGDNLMQYQMTCTEAADGIVLTTTGAVNQRDVLRDQALLHIPDRVVDPVTAPLGSIRVDEVGDVPLDYLDVDAITVSVDTRNSETSFGVSNFGLFPSEAANLEFFFLADTDTDVTTGGDPRSLGIPTSMTGIEFVGRVRVDVNASIPTATPTTWRFRQGSFLDVTDENVRARVATDILFGDPRPGDLPPILVPVANLVELVVSNEIRGPIRDPFLLNVVTLDPTTGNGDNQEELGGHQITITPPSFPTCQLEPHIATRGTKVTVHASDLLPSSDAHVILGDRLITTASTDAAGTLFADFVVPGDEAIGARLITVGTLAVTADCILKVSPGQAPIDPLIWVGVIGAVTGVAL
ncbi:MAG: hypothetical protein ACE5IJ_09670, partial [Thermoplasmata archaeon]